MDTHPVAFFGDTAMVEGRRFEESASLASSSMSFAELWAPVASGACAILASCLPYGPEASVLSDLRENLTLRLSKSRAERSGNIAMRTNPLSS